MADGSSSETSEPISGHSVVLLILSFTDGWSVGKLYQLDLSCFSRVQLVVRCAPLFLCASICSMGLEVAKAGLDAFYSRCI